MAGHSQFKNIMYRKGAQDKKRARMFAKIGREIMVAAKSGLPDPSSNSRLRAALSAARAANMPKDNVDRVLKKAAGGDDDTNFTEVRYEGYGQGGVAVIIEGLTDNRNRTASEVRSAFTKHGGALGETGSVAFTFEKVGYLRYPATHNFDKVFEAALDAGADNVESAEDGIEVTCHADEFAVVRDSLFESIGEADESKLMWRAVNTTPVDLETAKTLLKLIDILEDNDDVQNVYSNAEMTDEVLKQL